MSVTIVVGSQWGDEAKGKMVDLLTEKAEIAARFNGGDNAGHTVVNEFGTFKLRLTPNGIFNPRTQCVIGPGVVVNLQTLIDEVRFIQQAGIEIRHRYWISPRCHVVMPYHPLVEEIYETAKGKGKTGTTRRGIGPVYADKVSYNGIRLADLLNEKVFAEKLRVQLEVKNTLFRAFGMQPLNFDLIYTEKLAQLVELREMIREPFGMLQEALQRDAMILAEGAQGALLDNDWGTYPYCTASTTLAGGVAAGLGIAPKWVTRVLGVAKAYTSRVGAGPMPTELLDQDGETLRQEGQEYGTVTGRPRRCGWLDAEIIRFTSQLNGCTELVLTKLDVLDTLPRIQISIGYRQSESQPQDPQAILPLSHYCEGDAAWLEQCQPVYIEMEGWQQPTTSIRRFDELPPQAQAYVHKIEELVGLPVTYISVAPDREAVIPRVF